MDVVESNLDGRMVVKKFPSPGWFGVVIGMLEDGSAYAVEELVSEERSIFFVPAEEIEAYLVDTV